MSVVKGVQATFRPAQDMRECVGHFEVDNALNDRTAVPPVVTEEGMTLRNGVCVLEKQNVDGVRYIFRETLVSNQAAAAQLQKVDDERHLGGCRTERSVRQETRP
jgi:hypothetical protein